MLFCYFVLDQEQKVHNSVKKEIIEESDKNRSFVPLNEKNEELKKSVRRDDNAYYLEDVTSENKKVYDYKAD